MLVTILQSLSRREREGAAERWEGEGGLHLTLTLPIAFGDRALPSPKGRGR